MYVVLSIGHPPSVCMAHTLGHKSTEFHNSVGLSLAILTSHSIKFEGLGGRAEERGGVRLPIEDIIFVVGRGPGPNLKGAGSGL